MLTNEERKQRSLGVKTFSLDELEKLWKAANEQCRLYIVLALNAGFAQMEIATLRTWEVKLDDDPSRIERHRRKTDVFGKWILWDRTVELLRRRMRLTPRNTKDLAILTRSENPLVRHSDNARTDTIALAWQKLVRKAGVSKLSFKYLRKTGADMIRKIGGRDVSETYLAHTEQTPAGAYSNADFDKVAESLRILGDRLSPIFK